MPTLCQELSRGPRVIEGKGTASSPRKSASRRDTPCKWPQGNGERTRNRDVYGGLLGESGEAPGPEGRTRTFQGGKGKADILD